MGRRKWSPIYPRSYSNVGACAIPLQHRLPPRSNLNLGEMAQNLQNHTLLDICCPKNFGKKDNHIDIGSAQEIGPEFAEKTKSFIP